MITSSDRFTGFDEYILMNARQQDHDVALNSADDGPVLQNLRDAVEGLDEYADRPQVTAE